MAQFVGAYQILRPPDGPQRTVVLEWLEISLRAGELQFAMLSQGHPQPNYVYRGAGFAAKSYCTSLLRRPPLDLGEASYRSVLIEAAPGACRAGMMLRGTSGGEVAVALPFLALAVPEAALPGGHEVATGAGRGSLWRYGAALVGEVAPMIAPDLYRYARACLAAGGAPKISQRGGVAIVSTPPAQRVAQVSLDPAIWLNLVERAAGR